MNTYLFMACFRDVEVKRKNFWERKYQRIDTKVVMKNNHVNSMLSEARLVTREETFVCSLEDDAQSQNVGFTFKTLDHHDLTEKDMEYIETLAIQRKLFHASKLLWDNDVLKIQWFVDLEKLIVYFDDEEVYQIDPIILQVGTSHQICFEVIDLTTGYPITKEKLDTIGYKFNIRKIKGYQFYGDDTVTLSNDSIPALIYSLLISFFSELMNDKFEVDDVSYINNILVITEDDKMTEKHIEEYFLRILNIEKSNSQIENIRTNKTFDYFVTESMSLVKNNNGDFSEIMCNSMVLEILKMQILSSKLYTNDSIKKQKLKIKNDLFVGEIFVSSNIPIETQNLISFLKNSEIYKSIKEETILGLEREVKKRNDNILWNSLLYLLIAIVIISVIKKMFDKFGISFKGGLLVIVSIVLLMSGVWFYKAKRK